MVQLLIIADDFTGALDTGVQMAAQGAHTRVITKPDFSWEQLDPQVEVLVIDAETRHLPAQQAYDIVYRLVKKGGEYGVPYIYKKTDSALRGNIGAELAAVLEGSGEKQFPFLPAYPQINRKTFHGVHYIGDVPVSDSVFGIDPFEPVRHSKVAEIIAEQSGLPVHNCLPLRSCEEIPEEGGILVFDAASEEDLLSTGQVLAEKGRLHIMAGCAGFGSALNALLNIAPKRTTAPPKLDERLLVLCGSVNPITLAQMEYAEAHGFVRLRMTPEQKLTEGYFETDEGKALLDTWRTVLSSGSAVIIDSNDADGNKQTAAYAKEHNLSIGDLRVQISRTLGSIMGQLFDCPSVGMLLITGGDTLLQCMNCVGVYEMEPIGEMASGVVLSRFTLGGHTRFVISKSGGFGEKTLLCDMKKQIERNKY